MTLHLTNAVRGGIDRETTRTGGTLFGVLIVLQFLTIASFNTLLASIALRARSRSIRQLTTDPR